MVKQWKALPILTVTVACLTIISSVTSEFIQYCLIALSFLSFITFLWAFGGFPCKQRLVDFASLCTRCIGFYSGMVVSVIFFVFFKLKWGIPILSKNTAIWLLILCFFCGIPTMYSGYKRRMEKKSQDKDIGWSWLLFLSGLLVGIATLLCFLAINSLYSLIK